MTPSSSYAVGSSGNARTGSSSGKKKTKKLMALRQTMEACKYEAALWRCHLPSSDRSLADQWCSVFSLAM